MTEHRHIALVEDDFLAEFAPIPNHFDSGRGFDGCMFETFGEELAFVRRMLVSEPRRVWTVIESDGVMSIESGYHHVNRLGYLITRHAAEVDCTYSVLVEDLTDTDAAEDLP